MPIHFLYGCCFVFCTNLLHLITGLMIGHHLFTQGFNITYILWPTRMMAMLMIGKSYLSCVPHNVSSFQNCSVMLIRSCILTRMFCFWVQLRSCGICLQGIIIVLTAVVAIYCTCVFLKTKYQENMTKYVIWG